MNKIITQEEINQVRLDTIQALKLPLDTELDYINEQYLSIETKEIVDMNLSIVTGHNVSFNSFKSCWVVYSDQNGQDACGNYILLLPLANWVHQTNLGYCGNNDAKQVFVKTH